jgi:hypothetical protein
MFYNNKNNFKKQKLSNCITVNDYVNNYLTSDLKKFIYQCLIPLRTTIESFAPKLIHEMKECTLQSMLACMHYAATKKNLELEVKSTKEYDNELKGYIDAISDYYKVVIEMKYYNIRNTFHNFDNLIENCFKINPDYYFAFEEKFDQIKNLMKSIKIEQNGKYTYGESLVIEGDNGEDSEDEELLFTPYESLITEATLQCIYYSVSNRREHYEKIGIVGIGDRIFLSHFIPHEKLMNKYLKTHVAIVMIEIPFYSNATNSKDIKLKTFINSITQKQYRFLCDNYVYLREEDDEKFYDFRFVSSLREYGEINLNCNNF